MNLSQSEFELIRKYIEKECGIYLSSKKVYLIESRLAKLIAQSGSTSYGDFYQKLISNPRSGLRDKIVDAMTTNETLWFRDKHPFEVLKDKILPEMISKNNGLNIWVAASSTGQEPYSIAIVLNELYRTAKITKMQMDNVQILATDISPSALFIAISGRYNAISMRRGMTDEIKERYFKKIGPAWVLNDNIKRMVKFKKYNLQDRFTSLGKFHLVFLRNVVIYFSDDFKNEIFNKIYNIIEKDGYLILGASETLIGYTNKFKIQKFNKTIFYLTNK